MAIDTQTPDMYDNVVPITTAPSPSPVPPAGPSPQPSDPYANVVPIGEAPSADAHAYDNVVPLQGQPDEAINAANADLTRDDLARMWLSSPSVTLGSQPQSLEQLHTIEAGAQRLGLSLDDVIQTAESKSR
jgi:hypothetical protein